MTGFDFISLAIKLANSSTEAELRTSVSRAYYGAFHVAKELVESCGVVLARGSNPHDKVYYCLDNCADEDAKKAGSKLNSLRAVRNDADYELGMDQFTSQRNIQRHLRNANDIVNAISSCHQKLASLRRNLRDQAKKLGLTVLGDN
jgi:uncharacterized protein (UPF0332 family)